MFANFYLQFKKFVLIAISEILFLETLEKRLKNFNETETIKYLNGKKKTDQKIDVGIV